MIEVFLRAWCDRVHFSKPGCMGFIYDRIVVAAIERRDVMGADMGLHIASLVR